MKEKINITFDIMKVMGDLGNSSLSGVVMIKSLLEQAEERIEVEVMTTDNSFKLLFLFLGFF